jgi:hypothetical protein
MSFLNQRLNGSAFLRRLRVGLLACRADAGELKRVAEAGVPALLRNLVFETLDHALVERFDLMAGAADQIVMVMVPVS